MQSSAHSLHRGTFLGVLAIVLWSLTVALARSMSETIGALAAGAAVYCFAGLLLTATALIRRRSFASLSQMPVRYVFGCGGLFVLYTLTLFEALGLAASRTQSLEIALLNYLWPALTLLFSVPIVGNRATWALLPGTALAFTGVVIGVSQGALSLHAFASNLVTNPVAYGMGALAGIIWGLYSNLTRRWGKPGQPGAVWLFTLGTGFVFGIAMAFQPLSAAWSLQVFAEIACLGLATATAYVCWDRAMREGDLVLVGACSYFTPLLSTAVSCIYLRVWPGASLWIACACVIAGSLLSWRSIRTRA